MGTKMKRSTYMGESEGEGEDGQVLEDKDEQEEEKAKLDHKDQDEVNDFHLFLAHPMHFVQILHLIEMLA